MEIIDNLQKSGLDTRISQALKETKELNGNNIALRKELFKFEGELKGRMEGMSKERAAHVLAVKAEVSDWS